MLIENIDHHRSRERIRDLGEVFTQEKYVEAMLDMIGDGRRSIWSDENTAFFEPCVGHGNFAVSILRRRLDAIFKKARQQGKEDPALYAVANALNTLWAIDIDAANIESCRARVFTEICTFLSDKLEASDVRSVIRKTGDFIAHVLCAIKWQIRENEALSALTIKTSAAQKQADLTRMGHVWFEENGHHFLDFSVTWVSYYKSCSETESIPFEFEKAERFIQGVLSAKTPSIKEFSFAKVVLSQERAKSSRIDEQAAG